MNRQTLLSLGLCSVALISLSGCDSMTPYNDDVVQQSGNDVTEVIPEPDSNTRREIREGELPGDQYPGIDADAQPPEYQGNNTVDMNDNTDANDTEVASNINDGDTLINPVRIDTPKSQRYAVLVNPEGEISQNEQVKPDRIVNASQSQISMNLPEGEHTLAVVPVNAQNQAVGSARQVDVTVRNSTSMK